MTPNLHFQVSILSFFFGALWGSFLNVVIYRLPKGQDIVFLRSQCPHCQIKISWFDNIPILSWLILRGKCRSCKAPISAQYPLVELLSGVGAMLLTPKILSLNDLASFAFFFSIFCAFLAHLVIDLRHKLLPDGINLYLGLIFLTFSVFYKPWDYWLIGGSIGFFFPWLVTQFFYILKGQVGMGGGDIKLYAILGLYLGPKGIIQNIFLSCLLGSIIGLALIASKKIERKTGIPFGPFIIAVAFIQIFFPRVFKDYFQIF